jgi:hypothetical protein
MYLQYKSRPYNLLNFLRYICIIWNFIGILNSFFRMDGRGNARFYGLVCHIGDGHTVAAWTQNWVPRRKIMVLISPRKAGALTTVSDYINHPASESNVEKLEGFFLLKDTYFIRNTLLCHRVQSDLCHHIMLVTTKRVREDWLEERPTSSNDEEKA